MRRVSLSQLGVSACAGDANGKHSDNILTDHPSLTSNATSGQGFGPQGSHKRPAVAIAPPWYIHQLSWMR